MEIDLCKRVLNIMLSIEKQVKHASELYPNKR